MAKQVFLLEDDESVSQDLIAALQKAGYEVPHFTGMATGGGEALHEGEFDLIILDLLQQKDVILRGGIKALRMLNELRSKTPVFVITTNADCVPGAESHEDGVARLTKAFPFLKGVIQKDIRIAWIPELMEEIEKL